MHEAAIKDAFQCQAADAEEMGLTNSHSHQSTHNAECRVFKTHPLLMFVGAHKCFLEIYVCDKNNRAAQRTFRLSAPSTQKLTHYAPIYAMFIKTRHTPVRLVCAFFRQQVNILISRCTYAERGCAVFLCVVTQCDKIIERIGL